MEVFEAIQTANTADVYQSGKWPAQVNQVIDDLNAKVRDTLAPKSLYDLLDGKAG